MASEARISQESGTSYTGTGENSKYNLKSYTYPENLFSNKAEFGNTWVMININVLEQSKYFRQDQSVELSPEEEGKRWTQADARDQTVAQATGYSAISSGVVAAGGAGLASFLASRNKDDSGKPGTGVGAALKTGGKAAAATGFAVGAPLIAAGTAKRSTKRLASAIQLPMPNNLATPYAVEYGGDDTATLDMMMRIPGYVLPGKPNPANLASDLAAAAGLTAAKAVGAGGISAAAGLALNPKKEMLFTGVDFRNFTMDYMFYPKNMAEARYIKNIIDLLKFHMYPEYKSKDRYTYVYPSEFDITFYIGDGKENPWVNRVATSVLTNMNVNYTPQGVWATHDDGSPVMIQVSLAFKELSIITKDNLVNPADDSTDVKASY